MAKQQAQVKLAPWAKKSNHDSGSRDLSLAEIQRLEEEREREARIRREIEEQEMRVRQEVEAEQMRRQVRKQSQFNGISKTGHGWYLNGKKVVCLWFLLLSPLAK